MSLRALAFTAGLILSLTVAIWPVAHSGYAHQATSRAAHLHELAHVLEGGGFVYRADVLVRVSDQPAAWGFSVAGCDGLLLLSVLQVCISNAHCHVKSSFVGCEVCHHQRELPRERLMTLC